MKASNRDLALDALRGLAIFGMFLSANVPQHFFPAWMYHCQVPPPKFEFDGSVAGITWVDLVFPFFIFSMGAAVPLAMSKKIAEGKPIWKLSLDVVVRAVLLAAFGIFVQHVRPWVMSESPSIGVWFLALFATVLCAGVFARLPQSWPRWSVWAIRLVSIALIVGIWRTWEYPGHEIGFKEERNDIIILILSNVWLFGGILWLFTQKSLLTRVAAMGAVVAFVVSTTAGPSWLSSFWSFNYKCLLVPGWGVYLLTFIPGTIAGEILLTKMRGVEGETWSRMRWAGLGWTCFFSVVAATGFLFSRSFIPWACLPLPLLALFLTKAPSSGQERGTSEILRWSFAFMAIGLLFEPYQGGIKKDEVTLSYVLVAAGLAGMMLIAWQCLQKLRPRNGLLRFAAGTGQNPLLAYIGTENLAAPVWAIAFAPWASRWFESPWMGLLLGVMLTALLGAMMNIANKYKIVLRA